MFWTGTSTRTKNKSTQITHSHTHIHKHASYQSDNNTHELREWTQVPCLARYIYICWKTVKRKSRYVHRLDDSTHSVIVRIVIYTQKETETRRYIGYAEFLERYIKHMYQLRTTSRIKRVIVHLIVVEKTSNCSFQIELVVSFG